MTYRIFADKELLGLAAAALFEEAAASSIAAHGHFSVCLSGGSTPNTMFKLLADAPYRTNIDWAKVHVFWGDERCVPLDSEKNNAFNAHQLLLSKVPIPSDQIYRINGSGDPAIGAQQYASTLKSFFGEAKPQFDLVFLGMGDDAHTASLFPETTILEKTTDWVKSVFVPKLDTHRISLTPILINQAKQITFLIGGTNKVEALKNVVNGPDNTTLYPSQLIIRGGGNVSLYLDNAAAQAIW